MKKQGNTKQLILALALFALLIVGVIVAASIIERKSRRKVVETREAYVPEKEVQAIELYDQGYAYDHIFETYLFLGTDGSGNEEGVGEDYVGSMADFVTLFVFDTTAETYALLQLNRDTMTEVKLMSRKGMTGASAELQLCISHWYGGNKEMSCENTVDTVQRMLGGLPIDGYYALSMNDLPDLNHAVGGVTMTMEEDLTEADPAFVKGATLTLTDEQVETFVRQRYDIGDGENLGRMSRQRQFLMAFMSELRRKSGENAGYALQAFHELESLATSDINGKTWSKILRRLNSYEELGIFTFEGETKAVVSITDGIEHMEFRPYKESVLEVMTELFGLYPYELEDDEEDWEEEWDEEWDEESEYDDWENLY